MTTSTPGADLDAAIRRMSPEDRAHAAARSDAAREAVGGLAGEIHELMRDVMLGGLDGHAVVAEAGVTAAHVRPLVIRLACDFRDICARDGATELADVWNELAIIFAEIDDAQRFRRPGVGGAA